MIDPMRRAAGLLDILQPAGWPQPKGFSNGIAGRGRIVLVGGQIGWDAQGRFAESFADQAAQALRNILAVVAEAGGGPEHVARLTWYVVDIDDYLGQQAELGHAYRAVMGRHFPAMALVEVRRLVEPAARVEIEATAIVPDG